jgi:Tol biopolymer transport system component
MVSNMNYFSVMRDTHESIAQRITNETYNWVSDPRWHPSGDKVVATKWYYSSRSLGAGEGWEFPVPAVHAQSQVEAGAGKRLVSKSLPMGWTKADYVEQQIGHEQFIWAGDDALIYAGNVRDVGGSYTYSKGALAFAVSPIRHVLVPHVHVDVHKGIYAIFQRNLTTGVEKTLVDAFPGGASRPILSRDGRTLAFVRRVRDKEALVLK